MNDDPEGVTGKLFKERSVHQLTPVVGHAETFIIIFFEQKMLNY